MKELKADCLVIGTGLAGCATAYALAQQGQSVLMVTRALEPQDSATLWAQGGIVYQPEKTKDTSLRKDIWEAGARMGNPLAIEILADEGPNLVRKVLIDELKIPFSRNKDGHLERTEEAAHSLPRILFYEDATGAQIERAFLHFLRKHPKVKILTAHTAVDLLTLSHHSKHASDLYLPSRCVGAYVFDQAKGQVNTILAHQTVLATGGLGQLYLHTTNPFGSRGDGVAMAYRTGARLMNLEYVQFHPTALYQKTPERFLITEAIRGEGARLYNHHGKPFMHKYHRDRELAPRDVVSRAIHDEMLKEGSDSVYLDISHKEASWIVHRFPSIHAKCQSIGIDITRQPIPVVPAAHYSCGGIYVDEWGNTTIEGLKAVGEVSCTGLHGANRLASTSLLEDLVFGTRAAQDILKNIDHHRKKDFPKVWPWKSGSRPCEKDLLTQDWLTIKHTMWNYVGLVRTPKRLERAARILRELSEEVEQFYQDALISDELIGLRNGICAAQLVLTAARRNKTSIGCHYLVEDDQS